MLNVVVAFFGSLDSACNEHGFHTWAAGQVEVFVPCSMRLNHSLDPIWVGLISEVKLTRLPPSADKKPRLIIARVPAPGFRAH